MESDISRGPALIAELNLKRETLLKSESEYSVLYLKSRETAVHRYALG